jgi:hypothetical protein
MKEEQLVGIDRNQKAAIAVAYLLSNKAERPDETLSLFGKLEMYEAQANSLNEQVKSAKRVINEHSAKIQQFIGSLTAVADLIGEMLPDDRIMEWCRAYNMPKEMGPSLAQQVAPTTTVVPDIAGATSKTIPLVNIDSLSKGQ